MVILLNDPPCAIQGTILSGDQTRIKKLDGRNLDRQARGALRFLAGQRGEAGESPEEVIQPLGIHRSCIYVWLAVCREHGRNGLRSKPITGRPPKPAGPRPQKLFRLLVDHDPLQLKFPFALWDFALDPRTDPPGRPGEAFCGGDTRAVAVALTAAVQPRVESG